MRVGGCCFTTFGSCFTQPAGRLAVLVAAAGHYFPYFVSMNRSERNICWYSGLFITLVVNSARLLALRSSGVMALYWQFNPLEYGFQFLYNYAFCLVLFGLNLLPGRYFSPYRQRRQWGRYVAYNAFVVVVFTVAGSVLHRWWFGGVHLPGMVLRGYVARFVLSAVLVGILVRLILLVRETRQKDRDHAQLQAAYYEAQLELLKGQLNPHFLFNSFSSLSGLVREDPSRAQLYILHLSKVFRNAIRVSGTALVPVAEELEVLQSYAGLIALRLEDAFVLEVRVSPAAMQARLPHLSLQPLVENAAKHNMATRQRPLVVTIYDEGGWLVVWNNLQPVLQPGNHTGTGLVNLHQRFRLLAGREPDIERTGEAFVVRLPLCR